MQAPEGVASAFTPPAEVKKRPPESHCDGVKKGIQAIRVVQASSLEVSYSPFH